MNDLPQKQGLYDPSFEHDACGIGAIASIKGIKSHKVIKDALNILIHLEHRGGTGAENNSGDGAGILFQIPHEFFASLDLGFDLPDEEDYGVAQLFLSQNDVQKEQGIKIFKESMKEANLEILGYRNVPVNTSEIGKTALNAMPSMIQFFVKRPNCISRGIAFERQLYIARRLAEKKANDLPKFYFCSFSSQTIVYKGMLVSTQVKDFYIDLLDTKVKSAIAMVHSRFSTNTFPSWERAHPYRFLCHNGEINTIRGNVNSIKAREGLFSSVAFGEKLEDIKPVIARPSSDSAMFDNVMEFLYLNGRTLEETVMMMIPEPWSKNNEMDPDLKAFYEFHSTFLEPWDGPASLIFTDGKKLGASLDRNGLRPSRYYITKDDYLILFSETGALPIDESNIKEKRRLEPGKLLLVDTEAGRIISNDEIKAFYSTKHPYKKWTKNIIDLDSISVDFKKDEVKNVTFLQKANGYKYDELMEGILPLAEKGEEKIVAMGNDVPLATLSSRPFMLYNFFKQNFAQVTNPPIDSIREDIVMSTSVYAGREGNLLYPSEKNAHRVRFASPVLTPREFAQINNLSTEGFKVDKVSIKYDSTKLFLEDALNALFKEVEQKIDEGADIVILSDRYDEGDIAIPALLATSGVHQYLTKVSKRTHASLVLESAEVREIHHFATLVGFGATAVYPYLCYATIDEYAQKGYLKIDFDKAIENYVHGVVKGLTKIISKMGISTIQSYNGAQIFECIGLSDEVVDKYFTDTRNSIGGLGLKEIEENQKKFLQTAKEDASSLLPSEGLHGFRYNKEEHIYDPMAIYYLQDACRTGDYQEYKKFTELMEKKTVNIRDLMELDYSSGISIDEVEPVESIMHRFKSGAMSFGSISKEAHECIAIAMNRIGGKSNTGEGGEERERFTKDANGDSRSSAIKQVASGRFGVTIEYLCNAKEIQIKIAQGAKPGEGGQLPGPKVFPWVAKARHSTPGVSLISPPPHHDIYSIEDLAQLIYDLKNANPSARISVKLVAEAGVGTIASGVAKAGANTILISGYDGGTGASPRTSISNVGIPWEIGLSETHQTLLINNLRDRVRIETDGKLLTGRDVALAALLGADEFGFATGPLVAIGCIMMRVCNLNTCPQGIATQDVSLRKNFKGKPEYVINFMRFIAQELREYMALMGFRTVNEMIGRTDMIKVKPIAKEKNIDLSKILYNPNLFQRSEKHWIQDKPSGLEKTLDSRVLIPLCKESIEGVKKSNISLEVSNVNRTLGTILSHEITKVYKDKGLKDGTINLYATGNAGNSFGAFLAKGVTLCVEGDANDYLGKGLSGGRIIIKPSSKATFDAASNIISGNVTLYGATSGEVYLEGIVGERFCVRNSGADVVCLGCGQHGCEYMTGGHVLILGDVGRNFAAGMSGGVAYIYGRNNIKHINTGLVSVLDLNQEDEEYIKTMMKKHIEYTKSKKTKEILAKFEAKNFIKVLPNDYAKITELIKEATKNGSKDPKLDAFYAFQRK